MTAIFGGSELLFNESIPHPDGCVLDVLFLFGGSKMIIPEDWNVKSEVVSIFGGFSDKRPVKNAASDSEKKIVIRGIVIFGGGEIKSY